MENLKQLINELSQMVILDKEKEINEKFAKAEKLRIKARQLLNQANVLLSEIKKDIMQYKQIE